MLVPWSPHLDTLLQQLVPHYIISLYSQHTCNCFVFANSDIATLFLFFVFYILNLFFFSLALHCCQHLVLSLQPPCSCDPQVWRGESGGWQQGTVGLGLAAFLPPLARSWGKRGWGWALGSRTPPFCGFLDSGLVIRALSPLPPTCLPQQSCCPPPSVCSLLFPSLPTPPSPPLSLLLLLVPHCRPLGLAGTSLPGCRSAGPGPGESAGAVGLEGWGAGLGQGERDSLLLALLAQNPHSLPLPLQKCGFEGKGPQEMRPWPCCSDEGCVPKDAAWLLRIPQLHRWNRAPRAVALGTSGNRVQLD